MHDLETIKELNAPKSPTKPHPVKLVTLPDIHDVTVFAVKRPGHNGEEETRNIHKALTRLARLGIKNLLGFGSFEGENEICLVTFPGSEARRIDVTALAFNVFNQKSVLHLGTRQKNGTREAVLEHSLPAELDFMCSTAHCFSRIGLWRGVCRADAMRRPGFTYIPSLNQHYIAG